MFKRVILCIYAILLGILCAKLLSKTPKQPEYLQNVETIQTTEEQVQTEEQILTEPTYYLNIGITNDEEKYFSKVSFTCDSDYILQTNSNKKTIKAGKVTTYSTEDEGEVIVYSPSGAGIELLSLERSFGHPVYSGKMAFYIQDKKIYVVNRTDLESYITLVVPSEISSSSEEEALKTQAVCARSYAWSSLKEKSTKELTDEDAISIDCDVWDSTDSQVYNKQQTSDAVEKAVEDTRGEIVVDADSNEVIRTWYYSTSWGFTADTSVWSGKSSNYTSHLSGVLTKEDSIPVFNEINIQSNSGFKQVYQKWQSYDCDFYDSETSWFRWQIKTNVQELTKVIQAKTKKEENISLKKISCKERGAGGGVTKLGITWSDNSILTVSGMGEIRNLLGSKDWKIEKSDGSVRTDLSIFPSAFFYIEQKKDDITFYGGGFGHGVGLSQSAAKTMAQNGKNYLEILQFFYENIEVKTIPVLAS